MTDSLAGIFLAETPRPRIKHRSVRQPNVAGDAPRVVAAGREPAGAPRGARQ